MFYAKEEDEEDINKKKETFIYNICFQVQIICNYKRCVFAIISVDDM